MSIIVSVMDSIRIAERHKMSVYKLSKERAKDSLSIDEEFILLKEREKKEKHHERIVPLIAYAN